MGWRTFGDEGTYRMVLAPWNDADASGLRPWACVLVTYQLISLEFCLYETNGVCFIT